MSYSFITNVVFSPLPPLSPLLSSARGQALDEFQDLVDGIHGPDIETNCKQDVIVVPSESPESLEPDKDSPSKIYEYVRNL